MPHQLKFSCSVLWIWNPLANPFGSKVLPMSPVRTYFNDHNPPHFHVRYNDHRAIISIEKLVILEGKLPARVLGLVIEWAEMHQIELQANWNSLMTTGSYNKIQPLA